MSGRPFNDQAKTIIARSAKSPLQNALFAAAGGASVFACLGMTQKRPHEDIDAPVLNVNDEYPVRATSVNDAMNFIEAFNTARSEAGANGYFVWHGKVFNTLYDDEITMMSADQRNQHLMNVSHSYQNSGEQETIADEPIVIIHDTAPVSESVTDEMSFRDAFAVARADVGPGGYFIWHDNTYNTFTKEEMNLMTEEDRGLFFASVGKAETIDTNISSNDVDIVVVDQLNNDWSDIAGESVISEEYIDNGEGGLMHVILLDVKGVLTIRADVDNDGSYDLEMTPEENGNIRVESSSGETDIITTDDLNEMLPVPGADHFNNVEPTNWIPDDDFNPNADMSDWSEL